MNKHIYYGEIIDLVLDNSDLHKIAKEEGCSPTFVLGLQKDGYSNIRKKLDDIIEVLIKEKS